MIKKMTMAMLLLTACKDNSPHWSSGYLCSCEQRNAVREYVTNSQQQGMSDNSEDYIDHLFAVGVVTICDHVDSMLTTGYGSQAAGLRPCEAWYNDIGAPRP